MNEQEQHKEIIEDLYLQLVVAEIDHKRAELMTT